MPTRKNQHIALDRAHPTHNVIGPRANMIRQFSTGTAIAEQLPVGTLLVDLDRSATFVIPVVPFDQIGVQFSYGSEAGQFARASSPLQGTRKDLRKGESYQPFAKTAGVLFATLRQRQIGKSRMLPGAAPGSFAVPRQINRW
jgi:hypothetical protein